MTKNHMMDHSMHSSGMDMPDMPDMPEHRMCKMSMLLTTEYEDVCVLTSKWHIYNFRDLILSMIAIIILTALYELLKNWTLKWENRNSVNSISSQSAIKKFKLNSSIVYGFTVFYSFIIMLIFMTFNVWLMIAVAIGAAVGKYFFTSNSVSAIQANTIPNSLNCH